MDGPTSTWNAGVLSARRACRRTPGCARLHDQQNVRGDTESDQVGAEATFGGVVIQDGAFSLDSYMKLVYLSAHIQGYTEKETRRSGGTTPPGLALKYQGQDVDSTQAALGFTMRRSFNTKFGVVVPYSAGSGGICRTAIPAC